MSKVLTTVLLSAVLSFGAALPASSPAAAADKIYGCYKVIGVSSLNIRARPYSNSDVIGVAHRGEILLKWKRWCAWRGFWCPVQKGSVAGHADKRYLMKVACPE
ncbi:MAG: hypothetical protein R3D57_10935 [Hyphomicrobiaceae bacterium]